ncbi:hypothetical protein [Flaviaesturariibacter amylovorans]|uniref:Uncharacterized protein n=1 Tax=Flaviaesturariibacter amylovorans TaxID=1084520 RepID=A0ABP8G4F3_9BACT
MSFNAPLQITRANYEEYFLLYVDDELSAAGRAAVDAFVLLHPDLQEELALLADTKLEPEFLPHLDKEALLAPGIAAAALEEDLLSYIDDELPAAERLRLEALLRTDAGLQAGHAALLATKLDPLETLPCPFKSELYRKAPARRAAFGWWRAAAAVLLFAGAGGAYLLLSGTPERTGNPGNLAQTNNAQTGPKTAAGAPASLEPAVPSKATIAYGSTPAPGQQPATATGQPAAGYNAVAPAIARAEKRKPAGTGTPAQPEAAKLAADALVAANDDAAQETYALRLPGRVSELDAQPALQQQNINSTPVTDAPLAAYTPMNNADSEASTASLNNGRQGSVRSFLRKATRFIERRTGIRTTNEDDQLVVGTVAINLK